MLSTLLHLRLYSRIAVHLSPSAGCTAFIAWTVYSWLTTSSSSYANTATRWMRLIGCHRSEYIRIPATRFRSSCSGGALLRPPTTNARAENELSAFVGAVCEFPTPGLHHLCLPINWEAVSYKPLVAFIYIFYNSDFSCSFRLRPCASAVEPIQFSSTQSKTLSVAWCCMKRLSEDSKKSLPGRKERRSATYSFHGMIKHHWQSGHDSQTNSIIKKITCQYTHIAAR